MEKVASPKIEKLVTEITHLNLLEVSELSELLKKRLNLPDAPMTPVGGFAAPSAEEEEAAAPAKVKIVNNSLILNHSNLMLLKL